MQAELKKYETVPHTADVGIRARGRTFAELLENSARGMFSLLCDLEKIKPEKKVSVKAEGVDAETLLVNWLNELAYLSCAGKMLFSVFRIKGLRKLKTGWKLTAGAEGMKADLGVFQLPFEIKAATFHGLKVKKGRRGFQTTIIFDV